MYNFLALVWRQGCYVARLVGYSWKWTWNWDPCSKRKFWNLSLSCLLRSYIRLTPLPTLLTYLPNNLFVSWRTVLPEKLTGSQSVKQFPTFYGTRRFIIAFTRARQQSLSWASSIQSITPHPTSWRSILILPSHLCLGLLRPLKLEFLCQASLRTCHK